MSWRGVTRRFGAHAAVDDVTLTVEAGSLVTVVGPSGSGKTTLLRLLAGFERPDAGEITIGERVVAAPGVWVPPEHRRVGVVFQHVALFPHLSVAENVGFGLRALARGARAARVDALLDLVGLSGFGARRPHELSGGQAQRVALARAVAPSPDIVLLDEPFSDLDGPLRDELRDEITGILRNSGATAVLVTHDQDEALALGDQVVVFLDGRVAQSGPPAEVYDSPLSAEVASFLGGANVFTSEVRDGWMTTQLGEVRIASPDGLTTALVRPEDVNVTLDAHSNGTVIGVRYIGRERLVRIDLGDVVVTARTRESLEHGDRVRVTATNAALLARVRDGTL